MILFKNYLFVVMSLCSVLSYAQVDLPNDITFGIVDLKFDGKQVKICEMGEGLYSGFEGHRRIYGKDIIWALLCEKLAQLHPSLYFYSGKYEHKPLSIALLKRANNLLYPVFHYKDDVLNFLILNYSSGLSNNKKLVDYKGIFLYRKLKDFVSHISSYTDEFIIVSKFSRCIFPHKCLTQRYIFAEDAVLSLFRPKAKVYPAIYSKDLAMQIKHDLDCEYFVLKPEIGCQGAGIIFTDAKKLDSDLRRMFGNESSYCTHAKNAYSYWRSKKQQRFIAEEFVSSKSIMVDGCTYDPTMRVCFLAYCENQHISIDIFAAYWKLPVMSLEKNGTFEDKHRSCIYSKQKNVSAAVEQGDFSEVVKQLGIALPRIYKNLLTACVTFNIKEGVWNENE